MTNENEQGNRDEYRIASSVYSVRDAKANLSRMLREVKRGREAVITEHGKPVARVLPIKDLTLEERVAEMEMCGDIEGTLNQDAQKIIPLRIPKGLAQKYLQEDRR